MMQPNWPGVFRIFESAVERPEPERSAFLERACADDAGLRAAVEAMLAADANALPLLSMKGPPLAAEHALEELLPAAGHRVGPYRIVRELGRGGMGTVYLAEREDVGKQVALKLVRASLASPETLERFRVERKILARLEHPNIAALLDAGVTEDGTPWFAMERVEGEPLTAAADRGRLSLEARLRLFEQVCDAVAYAHRNRIVHRDLKPSNILVDGEGRVKLLDFGIAKLLGEKSSGGEGLTRTGLHPMTPEYAAPEQVRGEAVTLATDVYALGAVLYELLTGRRPQRVRGGSLAEIERVVLYTEPPLPSATVARAHAISDAGGEGSRIDPAEIAAARATDPRRLRRRLAGDLDIIVMRAIAKDPARRYPSAESLLADLRAHARGLPISARPDTRGYRLRKFAGRHRSAMAGTAAAAVLLSALAVAYVPNYAHTRDPARAAAATTLQLSGYLTRLFVGPEPVDGASLVAVYPFTFHGDAAWEHLGDGMVRLLGTKLSQASSGLRAVDPRTVGSRLQREARQVGQPEQAAVLAGQLGAGSFVLGEIVEARGRLRIHAALYRADVDRTRLVNETSVEGGADSVFALVDELGTRLLVHLGGGGHLGSIATHTTESSQALLAFLQGERDLRESRYAQAAESFRRAVDADSTFALAYYGMSRAANWMNNVVAEGNAASMAIRFADRLAPADRHLIEAWSHYRSGNVAPADSLYRAVLRERPHDVEAWMQLAEIGFHFGPMLGRPAAESREPFERVLAYQPDDVGVMVHLARLAAQEADYARLDSLIRRVLSLNEDGDQVFQLSVLQSVARADPELPRQLQERLLLVDATTLRSVVMAATAHGRHPVPALWLADHTAERLALHNGGAWAQLMGVQLELARGRWNAARARLERLREQAPDLGAEFAAAFLTFPFLEVPQREITSARDALARASASQHLLSAHSVEQRRLYLLGSLAGRLGDAGEEDRHVGSLERYAGAKTPGDSAFSRRFALDLRAHRLAREGRHAEALDVLGPPGPQPDRRRPTLTSYYKASERWLRAELLRELGRDLEALQWYATFPDPDAYDLTFLAPSHLRRAEIHDRRGEREEAAEHYRRFVELWADADPPLRTMARRAQQRLARLE